MSLDFDTLEGVQRAIRSDSIRGAGRARNYAYSYPFNFSSVANGSTVSVTNKITAAAAFVVGVTTGSVYDTATGALPVWGLTATNPEGFVLENLALSFSANDGQYQQNPVPWSTIVGTAQAPFYWLFRPAFAPGANVVLSITNNTGKTISGSVVFTGHHLGIG